MTVIVGQDSANKSHTHSITDPGHTHNLGDANGNGVNTVYSGNTGWQFVNSGSPLSGSLLIAKKGTTGITINNSGDTESRPNAITVKIWKRTV